MNILNKIFKSLPSKIIYAHCDIPCGIYSPKSVQLAAATVLVMVQKLKDLSEDDLNNKVRMIVNKEEHAGICKKELLILWTDYFKEEHLEKYPDLHDKFWKAAKLCSKNKQHIDEEAAQELVKAVDELAQIFAETKK